MVWSMTAIGFAREEKRNIWCGSLTLQKRGVKKLAVLIIGTVRCETEDEAGPAT